MSKTIRQANPLPWVLVANAARARCFERDEDNGAMREIADFIHPQARGRGSQQDGGSIRQGGMHAGLQPRIDVHDKHRAAFAREIADFLSEAALAHRYPTLSIIASDPFLGALRALLGDATSHLLSRSVALDLTAYQHRELERRVADALQGPADEASAAR